MTEKPAGLQLDADGIYREKGRIWIPSKDKELQLKVVVASHCGSIGHRGQDVTRSIIKEDFTWDGMDTFVDRLIAGCLYCPVTRSGERILRPLGTAMHGEKPNEVIRMDYLFMGTSSGPEKYILVIRDKLSGYVWLWPTSAATSEEAAHALATWTAAFGPMEWMVTDQGSHFHNTLITDLSLEQKVKHNFTVAYSPWANRTIERVCREALRSCKAILHEFLLAQRDLPAVVECIASFLNQSPLERLGLHESGNPGVYRTSLEVFTSHKPSRPLLKAIPIQLCRHAPTIT